MNKTFDNNCFQKRNMFSWAFSSVKNEIKRVAKYTVICGALGCGSAAGLGKVVLTQLKDNLSGDFMRDFHKQFAFIPSEYHQYTDPVIKKLVKYAISKGENEAVGSMAQYGGMAGLSFGFSAGLFRVSTRALWGVFKVIGGRFAKK